MMNSTFGHVGLVGALTLCGALAGCIDNGNDLGFAEDGGSDVGDAPLVDTAISAVTTTGGADYGNVSTTTGGADYGNVSTTTGGADYGNVSTTGGADYGNVGTGGSPADTSGGDTGGTTGAGGSPAETTACGPEE